MWVIRTVGGNDACIIYKPPPQTSFSLSSQLSMSSHTNRIFIEANPNKDIGVPAFRIVNYSDEGTHSDRTSPTDSSFTISTGSKATDYDLRSGGDNANCNLQANVCVCDAPSTNNPKHSGLAMSAEACKNKP